MNVNIKFEVDIILQLLRYAMDKKYFRKVSKAKTSKEKGRKIYLLCIARSLNEIKGRNTGSRLYQIYSNNSIFIFTVGGKTVFFSDSSDFRTGLPYLNILVHVPKGIKDIKQNVTLKLISFVFSS